MDDELRALDWACHRLLDNPVLRRYSTDPAASRLLEDEIDRRGLSRQYVNWLCAYTSLCSDVSDQCWAVIRATPEQKCMAFLEAVKHV